MTRKLWFLVLGLFILMSVPVSFAQDAQPGADTVEGASFRITEVLPANGTGSVSTQNEVTVIFNRPVVPLTIQEERDNLPDPLSFSPPIEGEGEWLNTSIYVFRPTAGFAGGTTYTIRADGLTSFDGVPLEPKVWSFTTQSPLVVEVLPEPMASDVLLDEAVEIRFNQAMDRASVEEAFSLAIDGGAAVAGSFEWLDDDRVMRFTANDLLQLDMFYRVQLQPDTAKAAVGGALLSGEPPNWTFLTVPAPAIVSTQPRDGETGVETWGGVVLNFASPMNEETLAGRITIEPEPEEGVYRFYSSYNDTYRINFERDPSTRYTVTVEPGMEDIYGNRIDGGLTFSFETGPLSSEATLQTPGEVGFYDALRDETEVYVSYRNVGQIDIALYTPPTADFVGALTDEFYETAYGYNPPAGSQVQRWSLDGSRVPENVRRYDLLNLNGTVDGNTVSCPGALPSRLAVGDIGYVISEPDPLRARSNPPDGEIVELMYRDYRFTVVDGPRCVDGIAWYQVTLRDDARGWIAESVDGEYLVDVRAAAEQTAVPVTNGDGSALAPGVYFLTVDSPDLNDDPTQHFMVVGTLNLTLKSTQNGKATVWATNVHTGEPVANVPVTLYGANGAEVGDGVTNDAGVLTTTYTPIPSEIGNILAAVVQTDEHFGVGYARWTSGISPWQFDIAVDEQPDAFGSYLYTDRPIYRPDQPVYFRGVVRSKADVTYTPPSFEAFTVRILDGGDEVVYEQRLPVDSYGAFSDTFNLAADATLGRYRLVLVDPTNMERRLHQLSFEVAEYRVPEYQVNVMPELDAVVEGATQTTVVDADYFFGGGVGNAAVEYSIQLRGTGFQYEGDGFYSFRDYDPYRYGGIYPYGYEVASGEAMTNPAGVAQFETPTQTADNGVTSEITVEATVRDESGVSVSGRANYTVHPAQVYVGVGLDRYVNRANEPLTANIVAVDWDSEPVRDQFVNVTIEKWQWVSVQEVDAEGRTTFRDELQQEEVETGTVVTDADGLGTFTFTPETGGVYKILAASQDDDGKTVRAAQVVWVSGNDYVQWRVDNDTSIQLVTDSTDYEVGDTAQILITSPFQGRAEALITVERDGVLSAEHVTLNTNSTVYELPITADYAPNIFVSVMIVKGVDETNPIATYRYGVTQLNVDTAQKVVNIEIVPDTERAEPRETVTYTVRTTDYAGEPISAQVGVGLTDLASLSLAPPNSGRILSAFYGVQGLSVRTSSPLTINTDEITAYVRDVVKGGGGGGGGGGGVFEIRSDFVDTAYWNATLETDENGEAQFAVTLPDNLTTWRLDARAITAGVDAPFRVGQETFDLVSTKPLLVRPVTPRFFVVGDEVTLSTIVNNNTGDAQAVTAFIEAEGVRLLTDSEQTQTIPNGERGRFTWTVQVENVEAVDVTFFASAGDGDFTDASKPAVGVGDERLLPVYRFDVPETVGTAGVVRDAESRTEAIQLPVGLDIGGGTVTVNVDTSLASVTLDGLTYLRNYPHQCTEQTISRFLPNIVMLQALAGLGLDDPVLQENLDEQVNTGLQILYSRQNVDGGWGWFSRDESNPLVTAYVLVGLVEAQEAGYPVSDGVVSGARMYLTDTMNSPLRGVPELGGDDWQYNREAFILYGLSRAGVPDASRNANLFERRERLNPEGRAFLALALFAVDETDSRIDTLMNDILSAAATSAAGTFWSSTDVFNWTTETRATSVILEALVTIQPESDLIPNVVRYLVTAREADAWQTTQETAWAVMALTDWMVVSGELNADYDFSVTVNDDVVLEDTASFEAANETRTVTVDVADLLRDDLNSFTFERGTGEGNLYYSAYLEASLPVADVRPLDNGILVTRQYRLAGEPVEQAVVGDVVEVRLTVIVPEDLHYVIVEDPIPAGMESINPDLLTSAQIGTRPQLNREDSSFGWGWWWFSDIDFRDEAVVLYSTYLPAGTYEYVYSVRATVPGTYNVIPTTAQQFYFPDVYGRGAGDTFTIVSGE